MAVTALRDDTEFDYLPPDWTVAPLGELIQSVEYGSSAKSKTKGLVPVLRMGNLQDGSIDWDDLVYTDDPEEIRKYTLRRGDILFNRTNTVDLVGKTAIYEGGHPAIFAGYLIRVVARSDLLDPWYLNYIMNTELARRHSAKVLSVAVGQANINAEKLKTYPIPLPPTLAEQRAVAEALRAIDDFASGLETLVAKKRNLREATMQAVVTGKSRLPGFDAPWSEHIFGELAEIRNQKVSPDTLDGAPLCIELESISSGTGRLLGAAPFIGSSTKYAFREGDVLFGRLRAYLRKYWLATFSGVCSTEIWPLRPKDDRLLREYLHLLVQTAEFVNAASVAYGTHMPRSDWGVLSKLVVRVPAPSEQRQIANMLADMDAELAALEQQRDKAKQIRRAMMQELLSGKTRLEAMGGSNG